MEVPPQHHHQPLGSDQLSTQSITHHTREIPAPFPSAPSTFLHSTYRLRHLFTTTSRFFSPSTSASQASKSEITSSIESSGPGPAQLGHRQAFDLSPRARRRHMSASLFCVLRLLPLSNGAALIARCRSPLGHETRDWKRPFDGTGSVTPLQPLDKGDVQFPANTDVQLTSNHTLSAQFTSCIKSSRFRYAFRAETEWKSSRRGSQCIPPT